MKKSFFFILVMFIALVILPLGDTSKAEGNEGILLPIIDLAAEAVSSTQIRLTWSFVAGSEDGFTFELQRKTTSGNYTSVLTFDKNTVEYLNEGLLPNTTYYYRVFASQGAEYSGYTSEVAAATFNIITDPPIAPANLIATTISGSQINLSWQDNSDNETGFKIERKKTGEDYVEVFIVAENITVYSDTGLSPNTNYFYRVRAYNSGGHSNYSNEAAVATTIPIATPPSAPTGLTAAAFSGSQVNLTWVDNANNESGFKIERKKTGESYSEIYIVGANSTSYADVGLSPNTTYYYRIRAYNSGGNSAYSNEAAAVTNIPIATPPAAPTNLVITSVSSDRISISWNDNSNNESGFIIERKRSGQSFAEIARVGANTSTFTNTGLSTNETYYYRVRAYNGAGNSSFSNEVSAATGVIPAAPTNLVITSISNDWISLSWNDNSNNESGFIIERKRSGQSYTEIARVGANVRTFTNTGLYSNETYYYRVRAYNNVGNSNYSNEVGALTGTGSKPATPTNLAISSAYNDVVVITWHDDSNNETGFIIERKRAGGSYTEIAVVDTNSTIYVDTGVSANITYYYRVRAYNAAGNSAYSNEANTTTADKPGAPTGLVTTSVLNNTVVLSWKDNANNETGFRIERKKAGGSFTEIDVVNANSSSYIDTGLSPNTTYYYRVRAYNHAGNSAYSNEVTATTSGAQPVAPTNLLITSVSNDQITLSWTDNANNETAFSIERRTAGGSYREVKILTANVTTYIDAGLSPGTTYYYRVRAYNDAGNSAYSNEAYAMTREITKHVNTTIKFNIGSTGYNVNGQSGKMDVMPVITEGRTLLPIRYVAEAIGATVGWNSAEQKITVILGEKNIELWMEKNIARVNGASTFIDPFNLNVKPITVPPGRTMLPLRFIAENLGCQVEWNPSSQEITVTY